MSHFNSSTSINEVHAKSLRELTIFVILSNINWIIIFDGSWVFIVLEHWFGLI